MEISKLLEKFDEQMDAVNYSHNTRNNYRSCISSFLFKFKDSTSPKHISSDEILRYLLGFKEGNTRKHNHCALKFFYKRIVHQKFKFRFIPYGKKERRLPIIIDNSDVQKLFDVCDNLKHKAIMAVLYGTGVRISELISIKLSDINSKAEHKTITIIGKGNKQRLVPLNDVLLKILIEYYKEYRPQFWLFENDKTNLQYTASSVRAFLNSFKIKAGISSPVTPHKFRHSFSTGLLESGTDLRIIQKALGHENIKTTTIYTHVSRAVVSNIYCPLNRINT